jgi:hypothetical protein
MEQGGSLGAGFNSNAGGFGGGPGANGGPPGQDGGQQWAPYDQVPQQNFSGFNANSGPYYPYGQGGNFQGNSSGQQVSRLNQSFLGNFQQGAPGFNARPPCPGGFDPHISAGHPSNPGFNLGYGGREDHEWQRARGHGRDRGRGASLYGRGGGRYNQAPAAGPVKSDGSSSCDRQFESATPSLEVVEQRKAAQVLPQFQLEVRTTGEKRKDPQDHIMTEVGVEAADTARNRTKDRDKGKWCFRCRSKGHASAECTTVLFCVICESEEHVAAACLVKKKPRPVAHAVGYAMDDLGFYHIPHAPFATAKKVGNTALVHVEGGSLTEEALRGHLKRLIPCKFEWDVQVHAEDTWIVPFPSKSELRRTMNFGRADLKDGMFLKFEEEEYFGHELTLLWMRVLNLPKVLRSFEVIWAIGAMFGATQRVDMITTRKNKFGRFQIAVLNMSVVPTKMDVVIGARFFELQFEIEPYAHTQDTSQSMGRGDDGGGDNAQEDKEDARNRSIRGNMSMGGTTFCEW